MSTVTGLQSKRQTCPESNGNEMRATASEYRALIHRDCAPLILMYDGNGTIKFTSTPSSIVALIPPKLHNALKNVL